MAMNKTVKIILAIFGLLIVGIVAFIFVGLYGMEIEDTYGDNQDIFYSSRQGDLVVNHDTKEFGEIKKTWTRFYITINSDTIDISEWWDDRNIEIYKRRGFELSDSNTKYEEIERLIDHGKLELRRKLRRWPDSY